MTTGKEDEYENAREVPPDWYREQETLVNEWNATEMGSPEYMDLGQKVMDTYVSWMWRIGSVGEVPTVMIAKNKLGNVVSPGWLNGMPLDHEYVQTWMDQLYWKE
jgi:hypothetical protein